ncbi:MAG: hypothetical protein WBM00_11760 [Solirubrobacterales bacterium]
MTDANNPRDGRHLLAEVLGPPGPELSCEECFAELDRYVELGLGDRDPDAAVPGMRAHLEGCPACAEDYRSLRSFIRSNPASES